ncbi:MAG: hypothetical protein IKA70_00525 [Alistipes sp.]|nr:hypothetical protein [Alistipes sp.]
MEQNEYFDNYENNLQVELLKQCTSHGMLDGTLLASDDIEARWHDYAPEYMADAVGQINSFPAAAVAWAAYVGMAVAAWWDVDWERYASESYASLHGPRGFDDMDEHIVEHILALDLESKEAAAIEDMLRSCAQTALTFIRREQVEAQSTKAFYIFARTARVMFRIGAALELARRGYRFEKVNMADMPIS